MDFWLPFFVIGFGLAAAAYAIARRIRLMAIVDLIWTAGLGIAGLLYVLSADNVSGRSWLVWTVLALWSFRLTIHLLRDRVLRGHEDPRYQALANYWGDHAGRNFFGLFLVQIVFVALFLIPFGAAANNSSDLWRLSDFMALGIAVVALLGETLADRQLAGFRAQPDNSGKVCREGLWRYSRHPNYFFEWVFWWAFVAFAWGAVNWWVSLLGPAAMYCFLRYLTGIPYAERSSLKRRGEAYRNYQQTTSAFFPWIPHKPRP